MTKRLLILVILALAFMTINGQTVLENDDFLDSDAVEQTPESEGVATATVASTANDGSTQETPSENEETNITKALPITISSTVNPEASTTSSLLTTVFDGSDQVYVLVPAPNPFPNLGPSPFYLRPQPPHPPIHHYPPQPIPPFPYNHPPMLPFMPMPHSMMFPPPMPQPMMIKPGDAPPPIQSLYPQPNQPGSQVILFNQQKNPGDAVMGQSTVYLKPDGNREVIIIK